MAVVEDSSVRARDGFTRVFVEVNDDVQRFYGELPRRFLHFSSRPQLVKESLLPKADRNLNGKRTAMIYKEGVLVREIAEDGRGVGLRLQLPRRRTAAGRVPQFERVRHQGRGGPAVPQGHAPAACPGVQEPGRPGADLRGDLRLVLHGPVLFGPRAGTEASVAAGRGSWRPARTRSSVTPAWATRPSSSRRRAFARSRRRPRPGFRPPPVAASRRPPRSWTATRATASRFSRRPMPPSRRWTSCGRGCNRST